MFVRPSLRIERRGIPTEQEYKYTKPILQCGHAAVGQIRGEICAQSDVDVLRKIHVASLAKAHKPADTWPRKRHRGSQEMACKSVGIANRQRAKCCISDRGTGKVSRDLLRSRR